MRKTIRLCDKCKKRVKEINCDICGCDLCDGCRHADEIYFKNINLGMTYFCRDCEQKVEDLTCSSTKREEIGKQVPQFKEELMNVLKKNIMLLNLRDTNVREEEEEEDE